MTHYNGNNAIPLIMSCVSSFNSWNHCSNLKNLANSNFILLGIE